MDISRSVGACSVEQLATAGITMEVGDDGLFRYFWTDSGDPVPSDHSVVVAVVGDDRSDGLLGSAPVLPADSQHDEGLASELLGDTSEPPSRSVRRTRSTRPLVGAAAALVLFSGVGLALWSPSNDPAPVRQAPALGVPAALAPAVVPVSWSEQARTRLDELEQRLAEAEAAEQAWVSMSPERREGLVPPDVPELVTRVQDLQRTTTVLETDLATADALEESSAQLAAMEHQLASVSQALSAPPAPPSEDVTRQLSAQKAMLESQAASLRESVDRYQERVQEATAAPLPAVEDSDAPARVLTLVNQEQDPTPDPVTTEELAAREPESTVVVEESVDPPADPPNAPDPEDADLPQAVEPSSPEQPPAQPEQSASDSAGVSVSVPDINVDIGNGVGMGAGPSSDSDGADINVNVGGLLSISVGGSSAGREDSGGDGESDGLRDVPVDVSPPASPSVDAAPVEPAPPTVEDTLVPPLPAPVEPDPVVVDPDAVQASAQEVRDRALRCAEDVREAVDAAAAGQCAEDAASSTEALLADVNEQLAEIDRQLAGQ